MAALPTMPDAIKVGILHSLSGTMAISETTLKDMMLMLIDQRNRKERVLLGEKARACGGQYHLGLGRCLRKRPAS